MVRAYYKCPTCGLLLLLSVKRYATHNRPCPGCGRCRLSDLQLVQFTSRAGKQRR